jgi:hypothetical protein
MKNVQKLWLRGRSVAKLQGFSTKLGALLVAIAILAGAPSIAKASSTTSQLTYIQYLVQLCGDSGQFKNTSGPQDYVQWAQGKGMIPTGGWKPTGKLTRDVLAQTLVQLYGLNSKKSGGDFVRILQREGINVGDNDEISRRDLISIFDDALFLSRLGRVGHHTHSPKKPPKPPGHHGDDDDDDDDHGGGSHGKPGKGPKGGDHDRD